MRSIRSRHARRRQYHVTHTTKRARREILVHTHHYRRFAGTGTHHTGPHRARPTSTIARKATAHRAATTGRKHPHKGSHAKRKFHHVHRKKGYHIHKRHGYHQHRRKGLHHPHKGSHAKRHLLHKRHLKHKVHRRKGYHLHRKHAQHIHRHKAAHRHVHRRHGLKHPHKGWHGHRHFKHHNTWHHKKSRPAPVTPISSASYLSMF